MAPKVRALVAEPSLPISNALKRFLQVSGYEVTVVHFVDDAVLQARKVEPAVVFTSVSGTFDGEALCGKLKRLRPLCPVVLTYPPEELEVEERATKAQAEAWMVGPLKQPQVSATAHAMVQLYQARLRIEMLEGELHRARVAFSAQSGVNTHDIAFFKRFLSMEIKRSRRYQYPLAFLMLALDGLEVRLLRVTNPDAMRAAVRAEALAVIGQMLRDIDLCVPFADDRLLVFLPHTPRDGALIVAGRAVAKFSNLKAFEGGTGSAGVATYDPKSDKQSVGFGSLMREASLNLRLAQEAGGERAEASPVAAKTKRDRVSIA
jgi:PleD family two-component response regulator